MGRILSFLKYLENFLRLLNSQCLDIWDREHLSRERGYCRRCAQLCLVRLRLRHFLTDIVPASVVSNKFIQICYDINVLAIYLHCSEIEAKYFKDFENVNLKCSISCFSFHRLYVSHCQIICYKPEKFCFKLLSNDRNSIFLTV